MNSRTFKYLSSIAKYIVGIGCIFGFVFTIKYNHKHVSTNKPDYYNYLLQSTDW